MKSTYIIESNKLLASASNQDNNAIHIAVQNIKNTVSTYGYCILRNIGLTKFDLDNKKKSLYLFLSQIGLLTNHNTSLEDYNPESIFWDIKYRGEQYNKVNEKIFLSRQETALYTLTHHSFQILKTF